MGAKTWTKEMLDKLKKEYPTKKTPLLAKELGKSTTAVKSKAVYLGIKKLVSSHSPFTLKKIEYLKKHYHNTRNTELADKLEVSEGAVASKAFKLGLKKTKEFLYECSKAGQYKKGNVPMNKGLKQTEYMSKDAIERTKAGRFKKNHIPHNALEVGEESHRKDSSGRIYVLVKVKGKRKLQLKHRLVWQTHHGNIPKGHNIIFKDGNTLNTSIENLKCISDAELMTLNSLHNYPQHIKDLIQLKGAISKQINKKKKKHGTKSQK